MSIIEENYQAVSALIGWIVEALEFVPMPPAAGDALAVLIQTQADLKAELQREQETKVSNQYA